MTYIIKYLRLIYIMYITLTILYCLLHVCPNGFGLSVIMTGAHESYFSTNVFLFDLELNHRPILKPIVHETWGNNHMKMRPQGKSAIKCTVY